MVVVVTMALKCTVLSWSSGQADGATSSKQIHSNHPKQWSSGVVQFGREGVRTSNFRPTNDPSRSVAPLVTGCFINVLLTFCALIGHYALDSSSVSIPLSLFARCRCCCCCVGISSALSRGHHPSSVVNDVP